MGEKRVRRLPTVSCLDIPEPQAIGCVCPRLRHSDDYSRSNFYPFACVVCIAIPLLHEPGPRTGFPSLPDKLNRHVLYFQWSRPCGRDIEGLTSEFGMVQK